ncbi:beta-ketoacyl-ACP synthase III [Clostridium senegalense]|uniref:beta-ketoacyl-ACP synthase III n=1 Tax=Clostridium senegalense TaxID=1465809 RepID=UPI0002FA1FDA|nr:beta-ketoacyl-ACP synthase III [Clostridium senegalense]
MKVKIVGTGRSVPSNVVTNDMLSTFLDTSDQWIYSRTGIKQRYISTGESNSQLCIEAAKKALKDADLNGKDIDIIIVATITPDKVTPATACLVQSAIGASNAMAFDISAACSGFVYGLNIASQFINSKAYNNALIIGGEVLSKILDWQDRSICVLFGDGAGAAILSRSKEDCIKSIECVSVGEKSDCLTCDGLELKNIYVPHKEEFSSNISMNGKEIFRFAVRVIENSIERILDENNLTFDDIDYVIPHQANSRIIEAVIKAKGYDKEKFYMNMSQYGNTSAASIPIALDELNKNGLLKEGMKLVLIGFGGGLTYGSALINWKK